MSTRITALVVIIADIAKIVTTVLVQIMPLVHPDVLGVISSTSVVYAMNVSLSKNVVCVTM